MQKAKERRGALKQLPEGANVRISHRRPAAGLETLGVAAEATLGALRQQGLRPHVQGGRTVARIELPDGRMFTGEAVCRPDENFNKKLGRLIATGRALKEFTIAERGDA